METHMTYIPTYDKATLDNAVELIRTENLDDLRKILEAHGVLPERNRLLTASEYAAAFGLAVATMSELLYMIKRLTGTKGDSLDVDAMIDSIEALYNLPYEGLNR